MLFQKNQEATMLKYFKYAFFIILFIVVGCAEKLTYNDDDIAAIVKGEEITIGELRFLYPDENVLEMIEGTVKARLVMQEAKEMNIDVSEEINQTKKMMATLPPKDSDNPTGKSIREFAESQAQKLNMDPEEYHTK